jgi:hypothetical protein
MAPLITPAHGAAQRHCDEHGERRRQIRVSGDLGPDEVGRTSDDRADRKINVAREHDERLPDGHHRDDRHA